MKLRLSFKEYLRVLNRSANEPLSLQHILIPFGLGADQPASRSLLVGFLIEALQQELGQDCDNLDVIDVLNIADDLGFTPASRYLKELPLLISQFASLEPEYSVLDIIRT